MKKPIQKFQGKPVRRFTFASLSASAPQGKHFYSHIVETTEISLALADMDLSQEERVHLITLVESNLHHEVLDLVLTELGPADKKIFLKHLADENHIKAWEHLSAKVENIEEKIRKVAEDLKKELHSDIKKVKKK